MLTGSNGITADSEDYLDQHFPQTDRRRAELSQKQNALEEVSSALAPQLRDREETGSGSRTHTSDRLGVQISDSFWFRFMNQVFVAQPTPAAAPRFERF